MPYKLEEVKVYYDLSDFDDEELLEEIEERNLNYNGRDMSQDMEKAIDYYKRGQIKEAMIQLSYAIPEFRDIEKYIKEGY